MWRDRINVLDKKRNRILQAGGADRIEKQHKSGKLTARERIDMLLIQELCGSRQFYRIKN